MLDFCYEFNIRVNTMLYKRDFERRMHKGQGGEEHNTKLLLLAGDWDAG